MNGQMTLFDFEPALMTEGNVGEYVYQCGAVIPHIMRRAYIGKKVLVDVSTQSMVCFQIGILEDVIPAFYWRGDERIETERSIVYTGKKQRSLITHMPGLEIREVLPWDAYPGRKKNWRSRG